MHIGVRRMTLRASHCHSLKDKRAVLRKLESRVRARYHLPIAEVAQQDIWQRIVIGFAVVGSDRVSVERTSADIAGFIESTGLAEMVHDEHETVAYGDGPVGDQAQPDTDSSWIPDSWTSEELS